MTNDTSNHHCHNRMYVAYQPEYLLKNKKLCLRFGGIKKYFGIKNLLKFSILVL